MFYTTLEVSVPVHQVRCDVTYHNPRHATAFERMLLGLTDRVPADSPMRQLSVVEVFGQHLCVPLAAGLLAPSLDDLVELGVLALATPGRPTPTLTLGALQLTAPRGRSVLELGQVPGRPTVVQTAHTFDPIPQELRRSAGWNEPVPTGPLHAHLAAERFAAVDSLPAVRGEVRNGNYAWKRAGCVIEDVRVAEVTVGWRAVQVRVDIDGNARVTLTVPGEPALERYLRSLPGNVLWQELAGLGLDAPQSGLATATLTPTQRLVAAADAAGERRLPSEPMTVVRRPNDAAATAAKQRATIELAALGTTPTVKWASAHDSVVVQLGDVEPESEFVDLIVRQRGTVLDLRMRQTLQVHVEQEQYAIGATLSDSGQAARDVWDVVVGSATDVALASPDPADVALLALWQNAPDVLQLWHQRMAVRTLSELPEAARLVRRRVAGLTGKPLPQPLWEETLDALVVGLIEKLPGDLSLEVFVQHLTALRKLDAGAPGHWESLLLAHLAPIVSADGLRALRAAVRPAKLPEQALPLGIQLELADEALQAEPPVFGSETALERSLAELRRAADEVKGFLQVPLRQVRTAADATRLLQKAKPTIRKPLERCDKALCQVAALAVEPVIAAPAVADLARAVDLLRAEVAERTAGASGRRPLVIDTSALLDFPRLVSELGRDDLAIVPKVVLAELDTKKRDPQTKKAAAAAIAELNRHRTYIESPDTDLGAMPEEFRDGNDDRILAAALPRKWHGVVLLTCDKNLQNKAASMGIDARIPQAVFGQLRRQPAKGG